MAWLRCFFCVAVVALVFVGFAIPSQAISVIGIWEGQCISKYDSKYNCLAKRLVGTFPYYMNISQAAEGKYKFDVKRDASMQLGREIAKSSTTSYTQGLQGDPNLNPVCTEDTDGYLPAFSMLLRRVGYNDVMTIESSQMVDEGRVCTLDHKPLFCHITRDDPGKLYANQICILFRKGKDR